MRKTNPVMQALLAKDAETVLTPLIDAAIKFHIELDDIEVTLLRAAKKIYKEKAEG